MIEECFVIIAEPKRRGRSKKVFLGTNSQNIGCWYLSVLSPYVIKTEFKSEIKEVFNAIPDEVKQELKYCKIAKVKVSVEAI